MVEMAAPCPRLRLVLKVEEGIQGYESQEGFEVSPEQIVESREFLEKYLSSLKSDAREVVSLVLAGHTLEEVGKTKGFTRERARQIKAAALKHLQGTRMYKDIEN